MSNITEMELQNLRHLLLAADLEKEKYKAYAEQCTDSNLKSFFEKESHGAETKKQTLSKFLN